MSEDVRLKLCLLQKYLLVCKSFLSGCCGRACGSESEVESEEQLEHWSRYREEEQEESNEWKLYYSQNKYYVQCLPFRCKSENDHKTASRNRIFTWNLQGRRVLNLSIPVYAWVCSKEFVALFLMNEINMSHQCNQCVIKIKSHIFKMMFNLSDIGSTLKELINWVQTIWLKLTFEVTGWLSTWSFLWLKTREWMDSIKLQNSTGVTLFLMRYRQ